MYSRLMVLDEVSLSTPITESLDDASTLQLLGEPFKTAATEGANHIRCAFIYLDIISFLQKVAGRMQNPNIGL